MIRAFLALGSNLGDRHAHLQAAVEFLHRSPGLRVRAVSSVYETDPVGGPVQDDFLNAVVEVATSATPHELLAVAQQAEAAAGRVRTEHWGPRTLDVDVVLIDGVELDDPDLTIPHPRWRERGFVLAPMHDLDPTLVDAPADGGADGWAGVRRAGVDLAMPT